MSSCINPFLISGKSLVWEKLKKDEKIIKNRREYVECLLKNIISHFNCHQKCSYIITGSNKITSDLDITLYGEKVPEIINNFNKIIYKTFNNYPDVALDTNLYSNGFLFVPVSNFNHIKICDQYCNLYYIKIRNEEQQKKDYTSQTIWAFVHLLKLVNPKQRKEIFCHLKKVDNHPEFYTRILANYNKIKKSNFTTDYTKRLKKVREMIVEYEKNIEPNDVLAKRIKNNISISNFYVHEAYITQGAFFHVVVLSQLKININMPAIEFIHSAIENLGFYLQYLNQGTKKQKYIIRIEDALKHGGVSINKNEITKLSKFLPKILENIFL